jgi:branched-chain amino acid transport system ATP-binding protein
MLTSGMTMLLELRDVHAGYDGIGVLRGIDLAVPAGSMCALLGANGAGKTTTLKVAAGLHPVAAGMVMLAGRRVNAAGPQRLVGRGVCLIPEARGIFPNLSVRENLRMLTHFGSCLRDVEEVVFAQFPVLFDRRAQLAGSLSGGEQQMLALSRALVADPAVLLVDELSMGLAPRVVEHLYEVLAGMARRGVGVLVVEQLARVVLGVADRAAVMVNGRIEVEGAPADVERSLAGAYLGR